MISIKKIHVIKYGVKTVAKVLIPTKNDKYLGQTPEKKLTKSKCHESNNQSSNIPPHILAGLNLLENISSVYIIGIFELNAKDDFLFLSSKKGSI